MNRTLTDAFPREQQASLLGFLRDGPIGPPGLTIAAAGSPAAKASAFDYRINGKIYAKAAQATISLVTLGVVAAGKTSAVFLTIDAAGNVTVSPVVPDESGDIVVPDPGYGLCLFGAVKVSNGAATAFTGGTTALDAASVTATYYNLSGVIPGESL
jgi:hypothetical protein